MHVVTPYSVVSEYEDFLNDPKYLSYEELTKHLHDIESQHSNVVKLHSVGKSVQGRDLWAVEISTDVKRERALGKPMFKYVANMHGDETVGYMLSIFLISYLVHNYERRITRIERLVNTTDIFIMPSMNPDGYTIARVSANT
jgi:carboxypeptidase D